MRAVLLAVVAAVGAGSAAGQDPAPAPGPEAFYPDGGLLTTRPAAEPSRLQADVMVGFPFTARVQCRVAGGWWAEGGVAAVGTLPGVFAGARWDGYRSDGTRDNFLIRPGVDAYFFPSRGHFRDFDRGTGAVAVDAELVWQRRWSDRFRGSLGLRLGGAAVIFDRAVVPLPTGGVFFGFQY
ncbi:MAG: hypothetical protein C0501_11260 [Isosphaera sp.]|nr:hypothetical protein [Isosphaera sp.]